MINQKIAIRCITEVSKGYGNLSRCLILADSLRKRGFNITFFINQNTFATNEIKKHRFELYIIPKTFSFRTESKFLDETMNSKNYQALIIDMREYGQSISKNLSNKRYKTILVDDAWCNKAYANLVINGTIVKNYHNYEKINKNSKLLLGPKYWIMKNGFRKYKKNISEIQNKKKYHIIISVGGSDPNNVSLFVVKALVDFHNITITIIVGPFFLNITKLKKLSKKKKNLNLLVFPTKIEKEFKKADVVISGSGSTLFELAYQKIPTISIAMDPHQIPYGNAFAKRGSTIHLGLWKNVKEIMIKESLINILNNKSKRRKMSLAGSKIIDGRGVSRVVTIIEKMLSSLGKKNQ